MPFAATLEQVQNAATCSLWGAQGRAHVCTGGKEWRRSYDERGNLIKAQRPDVFDNTKCQVQAWHFDVFPAPSVPEGKTFSATPKNHTAAIRAESYYIMRLACGRERELRHSELDRKQLFLGKAVVAKRAALR